MLALEMAAFWLSGNWAAAGSALVPVVSGSGIIDPGRPQYKSWLVNCADSDTIIVALHDFEATPSDAPIAPDMFNIQTITSVGNSARANWGVNVTPTQVIVTKQAATGSGGTPAAKLIAAMPHSIIQ